MPAGWIPRGLEQKEKPSITVENQIKFRPQMFDYAKVYLVLQVVLGIALMIGVISNLYGWTTAEKWLGGGLLWWQIINWSGILERKPWLWISETLRNILTPLLIISFFENYSNWFPAIITTALFCIGWTIIFFRLPNTNLKTVAE